MARSGRLLEQKKQEVEALRNYVRELKRLLKEALKELQQKEDELQYVQK